MAAKTPPGASIRNKPYTIRSLQKAANALRSILLYSVKIDALNAAPPVQVFTGGKAKRPTLPSRTHLKALLYEIQYLRNAEVIKAAKACGAETEGKTQEEVATGLGISLATYKRHRNGTTVGNGKDSADFAKLLIFTGMRVDEARNLKWGDINLEKGQITVHGTKTSSSYRTIPMIPELKAHLESLGGEHHPTGHVSKVKNINRALASACKRLSIPKLTHHSLRHLFATIAIESRVDIPTVSSWLGHADGGSLAMRVYGHLRDEHSQAEAQKVFALK